MGSILGRGQRGRGFTLIELMLVVGIVGVLAGLALYGVKRYVMNAKTAEARNAVGQMAKDAKTAYEREALSPTVMGLGTSSKVVNTLCVDAPQAVPSGIDKVKGKKYQSAPSDWTDSGSTSVGFVCLHFSLSDPQYYMYDYKGSSGETGTFVAYAYGDLDGDGITSTFSIGGAVSGGVVLVAPTFREENPDQ